MSSSSSPPRTVAVVMPALNESAVIQRAIAAAWDAGADEVIVSDGGSSDDTVPRARLAGAQVVSSPAGRAIQQNRGAAVATSEVLLFQHVDNWLGPQAIDQIRRLETRDQPCLGAFRQQIDASGLLYRLLELGNAWRVQYRRLPFGDQGIFMSRRLFDQLGGFPTVRLMEDVVLMRVAARHVVPQLLPGPIHVSARRWQKHGVVRQTCRNFGLMAAYRCGIHPDRLAGFYPRHDAQKDSRSAS
ncbi:MAG: TIGR04283 family arsenosugar biosynthesis glycosyltransferase [Planctomycetales bacterium]|nr:TIGR04283 family arsenosugar biosynthesis glycosyltransferase [Planctomycetales bacterium]